MAMVMVSGLFSRQALACLFKAHHAIRLTRLILFEVVLIHPHVSALFIVDSATACPKSYQCHQMLNDCEPCCTSMGANSAGYREKLVKFFAVCACKCEKI